MTNVHHVVIVIAYRSLRRKPDPTPDPAVQGAKPSPRRATLTSRCFGSADPPSSRVSDAGLVAAGMGAVVTAVPGDPAVDALSGEGCWSC